MLTRAPPPRLTLPRWGHVRSEHETLGENQKYQVRPIAFIRTRLAGVSSKPKTSTCYPAILTNNSHKERVPPATHRTARQRTLFQVPGASAPLLKLILAQQTRFPQAHHPPRPPAAGPRLLPLPLPGLSFAPQAGGDLPARH